MAVKMSQGLLHTLFLALHLWRPTLEGVASLVALATGGREEGSHEVGGGVVRTEVKRCGDHVILEYYIICNNTDQDLIIGQVCKFVCLSSLKVRGCPSTLDTACLSDT